MSVQFSYVALRAPLHPSGSADMFA